MDESVASFVKFFAECNVDTVFEGFGTYWKTIVRVVVLSNDRARFYFLDPIPHNPNYINWTTVEELRFICGNDNQPCLSLNSWKQHRIMKIVSKGSSDKRLPIFYCCERLHKQVMSFVRNNMSLYQFDFWPYIRMEDDDFKQISKDTQRVLLPEKVYISSDDWKRVFVYYRTIFDLVSQSNGASSLNSKVFHGTFFP